MKTVIIDGIEIAYTKYLRGKHWAEFKEEVFEFWGRKCALCGSKENLQCHHNSYERINHELLTDVVPICKSCHWRHHRVFGKKK